MSRRMPTSGGRALPADRDCSSNDFEQARDFVPLDPGEHQATLTRVKLTGFGEKFEVLDDYTWSFSIQ
jgi:hypothetical protein